MNLIYKGKTTLKLSILIAILICFCRVEAEPGEWSESESRNARPCDWRYGMTGCGLHFEFTGRVGSVEVGEAGTLQSHRKPSSSGEAEAMNVALSEDVHIDVHPPAPWEPDNHVYLRDRAILLAYSQEKQADVLIAYCEKEIISIEKGKVCVGALTENSLQNILDSAPFERNLAVVVMGLSTWGDSESFIEAVERLESLLKKQHFKKIVFQVPEHSERIILGKSEWGNLPRMIYREWEGGRYAYGAWKNSEVAYKYGPKENIDLTLRLHGDGLVAVKNGERFGLEPQTRFTNDSLPDFLDELSVNRDFVLVLITKEADVHPLERLRQPVEELEKILEQQNFKRIIFRLERS